MSNSAGDAGATLEKLPDGKQKLLFWACFASIVATSFAFVVRGFLIDTWGQQFNLTATQKGEIIGAGLWPFSISIILFALVIDRIGYGRAMIFAFLGHILSVILTITATGYWQLYIATIICALANGTVEAVTNPAVATMFPKEKIRYLSILHAGWPGGLVLGGILALAMGPGTDWRFKVALLLLPTLVYGILMLGRQFPIHERVAAGVSFKDMLREFGFLGALIVNFMIFAELGRDFHLPGMVTGAIIVLATLGFGAYINWSPGRPLFIFLLLIMIPLATTELGVDGWVTSLMEPQMKQLGVQAGWVLVYTSLIMMILRFSAGSIVHRISPLALLATCSAVAMCGLFFLSKSTGIAILGAATIYGMGKSFFWPTMLGVVSERFPRGGALTLNATGGVGMLGVGVVGAVLLGYVQDTSVNAHLAAQQPALHQQVAVDKAWAFGTYTAVDPDKVKQLPPSEQEVVTTLSDDAKKSALSTVAILPAFTLLCYLCLLIGFKAIGGYKPVAIEEATAAGTKT